MNTFLKQSEITKTNNDLILQNYMENVDKLKKIELPGGFIKYTTKKKKNNNIKYLIVLRKKNDKDQRNWNIIIKYFNLPY